MPIRNLFLKHKTKFMMYMLGVLLTAPSNLIVTLAFGNGFRIFETNDAHEITIIIVVTLSCSVLPSLLQLCSRYLRVGFMNDVLYDVRMLSYDKLMHTSVPKFQSQAMEAHRSKLTSDINVFEQDFFLSILNIGFSVGSYLLGMLVLFWIAPILALLMFVWSIVFHLAAKAFEKPTIKQTKRVQEANSRYHGIMSNIIRGLETMKLYKVEDYFRKQASIETESLEETKRQKDHVHNLQHHSFVFLAGMCQLTSFGVAAYFLSLGHIHISQLIIVMNLVGQLSWTFNNLFHFLTRYKGSLRIYHELVDYETDGEQSESFYHKQAIVVDNVSYAYGDTAVLSNVNLKVKPSEKILITGPSGTGKTSLLELLVGNRALQDGQILYDQAPIANIYDASFWEHVSYARQSHFMFDTTIQENIILQEQYHEEKYTKILKQLDLWDWIQNLPQKDQTILEENARNISGGQRQRLSLARALYQDRDVYIFDEPSASLDDATAYQVYQALFEKEATVIIVSHRHLNLLKDRVDQVLNLEKGVLHHEKI